MHTRNQSASGPLLRVQNLTVVIRQPCLTFLALRNISFKLWRGKTLALVGESASGKTLTALALLGLLPPGAEQRTGHICFAGQELACKDRRSLARLRGRQVATIFQDPAASLNPVFQVGRQISDVIRTHRDVSAREARQQVLRLFSQVRLPEPVALYKSYPHELSGGMAQRVMIAMALSCDPKLIIADEPTTALDVTTQSQILQLIQTLQNERGFALLLISHDIHVVAQLADSMIVMRAGTIIERGRTGKLMVNPVQPYTRELIRSNSITLNQPSGTFHHERQAELSTY